MNTTLELEWHEEKNKPLTLSNFSFSSARKVWWRCQIDGRHIWEARIFSRNKGAKCPYCSGKKFLKEESLGSKFPNLLKEWDYAKNLNLDLFSLSPKSGKKVWWKCLKGHEWQTFIRHRTSGTGCPYCVNQKCCEDNSLLTSRPDLLKEWNYYKNNVSPAEIVYGSRKKVWWKCPKSNDHEWLASVYNRTILKTGCPCCDGHKVVKSTCLNTTHPELCKEWDVDKNKITPSDITYASNKKAWWKCELGHEWYCKIYTRTRGDQCPICASSKGEKLVKIFLDENNLIYEKEYWFKDCKNKRPLPFDFAILYNKEVKFLIEYQGIHHYESIEYFGGKNRFIETATRDKIKFDYCAKNNIPLLIIPYWELKNINTILVNYVAKHQS